MSFKNILLIIIILSGLLIYSISLDDSNDNYDDSLTFVIPNKLSMSQPIPLEMYDNLEKYSELYDIPKYIFYNIAFLETRYRGPFDWKYRHDRTSSVGALGPMQIMPSTANFVHKEKIPLDKLKNDVEFNIETSAILLKRLYSKYHDWGVVCGYYNTGRPLINDYAIFCSTNKNYKKNWINT